MSKLLEKLRSRPRLVWTFVAVLIAIIGLTCGGLVSLGRLGASQMGDQAQILFNPDDVLGVEWQVGSIRRTLTRDQAGGEWKSDAASPVAPNSQQIQKLLIGLAMASSEHHAFTPFAKIRGSLTMKSGEIARFKWNGSVFKWTEGPHADFGGLPNTILQRVLESGIYFSDKPKVAWCKARPKEIRVESETTNFVLQAGDGGSWMRSSLNEPAHKIDPTAVEKWLSQYCEFEGVFWRDRSIAEHIATPATFSFELKDGSHESWDFDPKSAVIGVESARAIISPDFISALNAIAKIP
jgi:hypothetical protein